MSDAKHTPIPWAVDSVNPSQINRTADKTHLIRIASVNTKFMSYKANAEFIVRAVNCHEQLLEACKAAKKLLELSESGRAVFWKLVDAIAKAEGRAS